MASCVREVVARIGSDPFGARIQEVARYGQVYKDRIVARLLPPESSSVEQVSREAGVSAASSRARNKRLRWLRIRRRLNPTPHRRALIASPRAPARSCDRDGHRPLASDPEKSIKDDILAFNARYRFRDRAHIIDRDGKIIKGSHYGLSIRDRLDLIT